MSTLLIGDAAADPRVRAVLGRFVRHQRQFAAEATCLEELAELLPAASRTWSLAQLGRIMLSRGDNGSWSLRQAPLDPEARAAVDLAGRFGIAYGLAARAVREGVAEQAAELAATSRDPVRTFARAVNELTGGHRR